MSLSKTLFLRGLQCHKSLWLYKNKKELKAPISSGDQAILDQGTKVGELARRYFPGGVLIEEDYEHLEDAIKSTNSALTKGAETLYEATFRYNNILIRVDILKKSKKSSSAWDLVEVKSTTKEKDEHLPDLSVQYYVLTGLGFKINKVYLMFINNEYIKKGEIEVKKFLELEDMTNDAKTLVNEVNENLLIFLDVLSKRKQPEIEIGPQCRKPHDCDFMDYCWGDIPDNSIYNTNLSWKKKQILKSQGNLTIDKIPDNFELTDIQMTLIDVAKSRRTIIAKKSIREFIIELEYPLFFLDFETISPAIPMYDNTSPYEKVPFQFSLRVHNKEGEIDHIEFLGDAVNDPREEAARLLVETIGNKGSVIAYSAGFEGDVLEKLSECFPKEKKALLNIKERLWDLIKPFSKRHYLHPDFKGKTSIKVVLPVLIPEMSYEGMEISEGGSASQAYLDMINGKYSEMEMKQMRKNLQVYCAQDTLAMVKILDILKRV